MEQNRTLEILILDIWRQEELLNRFNEFLASSALLSGKYIPLISLRLLTDYPIFSYKVRHRFGASHCRYLAT